MAVAAGTQNRPFLDSYQVVNCDSSYFAGVVEVELILLGGRYSAPTDHQTLWHEGLARALAIHGLVFPLIKSCLGENAIEKMLAHRQALAASANECERMSAEADVKVLGYELDRRRAIRDLQIREYPFFYCNWAGVILGVVC